MWKNSSGKDHYVWQKSGKLTEEQKFAKVMKDAQEEVKKDEQKARDVEEGDVEMIKMGVLKKWRKKQKKEGK
ncbi:hypothetical protein Slin15195_G056980 [Septoria linicola]|uniref:Uncharacterized protein n=1 Tax=Septoria linicola TaxID=215465 RepID=A0A9Q9EJM6_9PEZI|nr:hypothetical protein Slin14017_G072850 [Septoria linicola]USW52379.1 hypothetical protein Slin15195_G056980 [Septoria linicola]